MPLLLQFILCFLTVNKLWAFIGIAVGSFGVLTTPAVAAIKSKNAGPGKPRLHPYSSPTASHNIQPFASRNADEQGLVQGALVGARAIASGLGPVVFAALFAAFSRTDVPGQVFWPQAPFLLCLVLILGSLVAAVQVRSILKRDGHSDPTSRMTGARDSL